MYTLRCTLYTIRCTLCCTLYAIRNLYVRSLYVVRCSGCTGIRCTAVSARSGREREWHYTLSPPSNTEPRVRAVHGGDQRVASIMQHGTQRMDAYTCIAGFCGWAVQRLAVEHGATRHGLQKHGTQRQRGRARREPADQLAAGCFAKVMKSINPRLFVTA